MLADKGELNGTKVEVFAESFGVRIEMHQPGVGMPRVLSSANSGRYRTF